LKVFIITTLTTHIQDNDEFDFFDDIERKLMDENYNEPGKNNDANVLFYEDISIIETVDEESDNHEIVSRVGKKLNVTYRMIMYLEFTEKVKIMYFQCDPGTSAIIGFVDPRTNKKYLKSDPDFYVRKEIIDDLYNKYKTPDLKWGNQSYAKITKLISYYCGFVDFNKCSCNLSEEQWLEYNNNTRNPMVARRDDDMDLYLNSLKAGAHDTNTVDINKSYAGVAIYRKLPWIETCAFDTWREFSPDTDTDILAGEYMLHEGVYGDEKTLILYDEGPHTYSVVRYLLEMNYITFNDIYKFKPVKHVLKADTFKSLFEFYFSYVEQIGLSISVAKQLSVVTVGQLGNLKLKQNYCQVFSDTESAQAFFNLYTENGYAVQYIDSIDYNMIILLIQYRQKNLMSTVPIWNQFIEDGKMKLNRIANELLQIPPDIHYNEPIILAVNTDSVTTKHLNKDKLQQIKDDTKRKDEIEMVWQLKLEDTIKIYGNKLTDIMIIKSLKKSIIKTVKMTLLKSMLIIS
jgi:hypothetical protein